MKQSTRLTAVAVFVLLFGAASLSAQEDTVFGFAAFQAPLSVSAQVPPITDINANGNATILVHMERRPNGELIRAIVDFNIDMYFEQEETIVALHVHRGARGTNGPVVLGSGLSSPVPKSGRSFLFRAGVFEDRDGRAAVEALLENPEGHYVNLHTASAPPGLIRGQLHPADNTGIRRNVEALEALTLEMNLLKRNIQQIARRLGLLPVEE